MNTVKKSFFLVALIAAVAGALWYKAIFQQPIIGLESFKEVPNIVPIVVIGSGPAGLNAALYGARAGIYTVVFQGKTPGGQLVGTTYVENWPGITKMLGAELVEQNKVQAETFGALMVPETIREADFSRWPYTLTTEDGQKITALTVIVATGSNPRRLSETGLVKGESEYWGYGVTSCAICDAPFYKGKNVVVIGGGDSAVEEATLLTAYADKVTMLVRGSQLRAAAAMQARLKDHPTIEVRYQTQVLEIQGDGKVVTGVHLKDTKNGTKYDLPTDGVFLAIGHVPNTSLFKQSLALDELGYITLKGRSQKTNIQGIFAAGDVADHRYRQAGVAAGDGIKAALEAIEFLQDHGFSGSAAQQLEKRFYDPTPESDLISLPPVTSSKEFDALAREHQWIVAEAGAENCSSCSTLLPIVRSVGTKLADKAKFIYLDLTDRPQELIKRFQLTSVPALLIFKKGALIARYDQQIFSKRELYTILSALIAEKV
jgi:thioredoxin reductase (NADPH)